jgi:hypothetical protein
VPIAVRKSIIHAVGIETMKNLCNKNKLNCLNFGTSSNIKNQNSIASKKLPITLTAKKDDKTFLEYEAIYKALVKEIE